MLDLQIIASGRAMPLFDLPAALGRAKAAREVGDTIDGLIAFLDDLAGDPDIEDGDDDEPSGDELDLSWPEWHERGRHKMQTDAEFRPASNDASDDDESDGDEQDGDGAEDEPAAWFATALAGPGCLIADSDMGADDGQFASSFPAYGLDQSRGPLDRFGRTANGYAERPWI